MNVEALNHIPQGFNNNIIWNFGHIIVTQQILCYKLSGLDMHVDDEMIAMYRKGTKPEDIVGREEIEQLKQQAISTLDQFQKDLDSQLFQNYHEYTTSFGTTLSNIEEGITFNGMHETLHLGYAMALRKAVKNEMGIADEPK